jgi:transcription termination factor Rho
MYDIKKLNSLKLAELKEVASELNLTKVDKLKKQDLVYKILDEQALVLSKKETTEKPARKPRPAAKKPVKTDAVDKGTEVKTENTKPNDRKKRPAKKTDNPDLFNTNEEAKTDVKPRPKSKIKVEVTLATDRVKE